MVFYRPLYRAIQRSFYSRGGNLIPGDPIYYASVSGGLVDTIGLSARTIYPLQYIQGPVDLTHADLTPTCVGNKEGTALWDRTVAGKFQIDNGTIWSFSITFDDATTSTYEFGTALSATTGVVFDTSGNGRNLLFTVGDTVLTCATDLEVGSDWFNQHGWLETTVDTYFFDEFLAEPIPSGINIPYGTKVFIQS